LTPVVKDSDMRTGMIVRPIAQLKNAKINAFILSVFSLLALLSNRKPRTQKVIGLMIPKISILLMFPSDFF
jgi:hypothetical protein